MPCVSRFRSTILAGAALSVMLWLLQADGGEAERVIEPQFSTHSISLLREGFYGAHRRRLIPNSVRDALYRQRRQYLGRTFEIAAGETIPAGLLLALVPIPVDAYRRLGFGDLPDGARVGVLGRHVVLWDAQTRKVYDVLPNFMVR
ncbi:MAG: hypothetical protein IPK79_11655 [Vampirovibrionales bacterium]|nr:hypothetical protein [Vampirovibrionales bacterium]